MFHVKWLNLFNTECNTFKSRQNILSHNDAGTVMSSDSPLFRMHTLALYEEFWMIFISLFKQIKLIHKHHLTSVESECITQIIFCKNTSYISIHTRTQYIKQKSVYHQNNGNTLLQLTWNQMVTKFLNTHLEMTTNFHTQHTWIHMRFEVLSVPNIKTIFWDV